MDWNNLEQCLQNLQKDPAFEPTSSQQIKMFNGIQSRMSHLKKRTFLIRVTAGISVALAIALLTIGITKYDFFNTIPGDLPPSNVNEPSPNSDMQITEVDPSSLPISVKDAINQVSKSFNGKDLNIVRAMQTQTDGPTREKMYVITVQGSFSRLSEPNKIYSKLSFSVLADGSKIWAVVGYDKGDNAVWQEDNFVVPKDQPKKELSYTDVAYAIPRNVQVNDPSNPRQMLTTLSGPHAIVVETKNGCMLVAGDNGGTNLWVLGDKPLPLLDTTGKAEFYNQVYAWSQNKGEGKIMPVWAINPHAVDHGQKIAFESNRDSFTHGHSVYIVNSDGSNVKLLLSVEKYGDLQLVGAVDKTVVAWGTQKHIIVVADINGNVKEYPINGGPKQISSDGKYIMFEKVVNNYVQSGQWVIDLDTGNEIPRDKVPSSVHWGEKPVCSPEH